MGRLQVAAQLLASGESVELGTSEWQTLGQDRIDQFADVSGDHQWIHVDPIRAAAEAPGGTTIVHGYLTLAVAASQVQELVEIVAARRVNYGVDKVRFLTPVPVGARVRTRAVIRGAGPRAGGVMYRVIMEVEVEGLERPAMVAETLSLAFEDGPDS